MRFIYIALALMLGMTLSAYRQFHKPRTLYQFHKYEPKSTSQGFCGTCMMSSNLPKSEEFQLGKTLFKQNCAQCHNKNMIHDLTGPALADVEKRWSAFPKEDLYNWIRSSQSLVEAEHPRAVKIYNEWNQTLMNDFPNLTDEDIEALLVFIDNYYR